MKNKNEKDPTKVNEAIRLMCQTSIGVLDKGFLCQSLSVLSTKPLCCVKESDSVADVLNKFCERKIGCVAVVNEQEKITGIFSERDFLLKVAKNYGALQNDPIKRYMTADPVTQPPDGNLAFALNLMSQGGFRHIPIVDATQTPIGMISVKDVVDYIVDSFTNDLLNFEVDAT